jgi:hypothetical protein
METCSSAMSTRVKQRAVIRFLTAEIVGWFRNNIVHSLL